MRKFTVLHLCSDAFEPEKDAINDNKTRSATNPVSDSQTKSLNPLTRSRGIDSLEILPMDRRWSLPNSTQSQS